MILQAGIPSHPLAAAGNLPQEIVLHAWRRDAEGLLWRGRAQVASPLPWWQRFPADLFSDFLYPGQLTISASTDLTLSPVPTTDAKALADLAAARGYAE